MKNVDRNPIEEEQESEFPGCLIAGILIAVLGGSFIVITTLTRIKDMVIYSKPVEFIKAAIQKQRLQERTRKEENIK